MRAGLGVISNLTTLTQVYNPDLTTVAPIQSIDRPYVYMYVSDGTTHGKAVQSVQMNVNANMSELDFTADSNVYFKQMWDDVKDQVEPSSKYGL